MFDLKEVLKDFKTYLNISAVFGGNQKAYESIENHILKLLYEQNEHKAYNIFYEVMDRRTLNTDSLLDAIDFALDELEK